MNLYDKTIGEDMVWSRGQIKTCRKIQHVERGSMEALPNLICGKFAVGGKDNLPPDNKQCR